MNRLIKMGVVCLLAFFVFNKASAQIGTKIVTIDSISAQEPIVMFDTTNFFVLVTVNDTSFVNQDSIFGDLFYYYLTDSMDSAGVPPRLINNDTINQWYVGTFSDILSIDIRPDEIRTTPVNLIVVWPAMINPEVADTDSIVIQIGFDGFLGITPTPDHPRGNIVYPCPAMQYIYIRPEEISLIKEIHILSMEGKTINSFESEEFTSGFINIDSLALGTYLVELEYFDSKIIRTKIIKR